MSGYFSRLSRRTGIALHRNAGRLQHGLAGHATPGPRPDVDLQVVEAVHQAPAASDTREEVNRETVDRTGSRVLSPPTQTPEHSAWTSADSGIVERSQEPGRHVGQAKSATQADPAAPGPGVRHEDAPPGGRHDSESTRTPQIDWRTVGPRVREHQPEATDKARRDEAAPAPSAGRLATAMRPEPDRALRPFPSGLESDRAAQEPPRAGATSNAVQVSLRGTAQMQRAAPPRASEAPRFAGPEPAAGRQPLPDQPASAVSARASERPASDRAVTRSLSRAYQEASSTMKPGPSARVHIGRISVEIHQHEPESPRSAPARKQAAPAPNQAPRELSPSRFYLRGY